MYTYLQIEFDKFKGIFLTKIHYNLLLKKKIVKIKTNRTKFKKKFKVFIILYM